MIKRYPWIFNKSSQPMTKKFTRLSCRPVMCIFLIQAVIMIFPSYDYAQNPYELNWNKDGLILLIGFPLTTAGYALDASVLPLTLNAITKLDRKDIFPAFDRFASYHYSESASNLSDILIYTCLASPFILFSSRAIRHDFSTILGMYAESVLFNSALTFWGKGGVHRIRPYAYFAKTPLNTKMSAEAKKSFFSGHSSTAFMSMIFLSTVYSSYYPNSRWKTHIWIGSILMASTVGYLRIAAGAHFLTDVLFGAIVGSAVGYLIPKIHETDHKNISLKSLSLSMQPPGITVQFSF